MDRLGKGLEAIISAVEKPIEHIKDAVVKIPIDKISSNPYQARIKFDEEKLLELAQSIKEKGVIQPVVVKRSEISGEYILVVGERRYRAAKLAGLKEISAIIKDFSDTEMALISLIENIQREDLNPVEEAKAYKSIIDKFGFTQEKLAQVVGKDRAVVANAIRLLSLDPEVIELLLNGTIKLCHARALAGITDRKTQVGLSQKIAREKLTVREVEEIVRKLKLRKRRASPEVLIFQDELQKLLGLKVRIRVRGKKPSRGRVEIYFHSIDEFERLLNYLKKKWH